MTGHSYVVYGPLAAGATVFVYEGAPDWPKQDRFWSLIEKHKVSIFYTAPTAIRAFMKWGHELPEAHDLSSLRLLGSVGEPINPEAWMWYHKWIGGERCPIVDTWWQTETGSIMITPLPGLVATKPGSATRAFPGIDAKILDEGGNEVEVGGGYLAITSPWPSMLRGIWRDPERFEQQYWSKWPGIYFTGDGAKRDEDGYFWLLGRVDDVINVAGHRIGTMEVESALVDHQADRRGRGGRHQSRDQGDGDRRVRDREVVARGRSETRSGEVREGAEGSRLRRRSARSRVRRRSWSPPTCRKRAAARSCAASFATSPKAAPSAT